MKNVLTADLRDVIGDVKQLPQDSYEIMLSG